MDLKCTDNLNSSIKHLYIVALDHQLCKRESCYEKEDILNLNKLFKILIIYSLKTNDEELRDYGVLNRPKHRGEKSLCNFRSSYFGCILFHILSITFFSYKISLFHIA